MNHHINPLFSEPPVKLARSETMSDVMDCFSGDPIVLEIEVSRFNAEVIWMKDGGEVEESSDVTITEDGLIRRLTIRTPVPGDSGKYTCLASDDLIDFQVKVSGKRWLEVNGTLFLHNSI